MLTVRKPLRACWLIILALYLIPTNWVSFALLLIEPTRSTTHGWVSTKTSRNSLKSLKRIFFQPIWFKGCQSVPHAHRDECDPPVSVSDTTTNFYFKLPYIGSFSFVTQKRVRQFAKCYCNNIDVKLAFSSFKIGDMFGVKDPIPRGLRTWAKPLDIYPHTYVSTWSVIGPLKFSDIYIILHNVALFVLMSVLTP